MTKMQFPSQGKTIQKYKKIQKEPKQEKTLQRIRNLRQNQNKWFQRASKRGTLRGWCGDSGRGREEVEDGDEEADLVLAFLHPSSLPREGGERARRKEGGGAPASGGGREARGTREGGQAATGCSREGGREAGRQGGTQARCRERARAGESSTPVWFC